MSQCRRSNRFPGDRPPRWPQRVMGMICAGFGAFLAGFALKALPSAGPLVLVIVLGGLFLAANGLCLAFGPAARKKTVVVDAPPKKLWMGPGIIFVIFGAIFIIFGAAAARLIGLFGLTFVLVGLVFAWNGVWMLWQIKKFSGAEQRLEQLEGQYKAGLYTEEEYREKRREILEEA